jgi:hypothetical protein
VITEDQLKDILNERHLQPRILLLPKKKAPKIKAGLKYVIDHKIYGLMIAFGFQSETHMKVMLLVYKREREMTIDSYDCDGWSYPLKISY